MLLPIVYSSQVPALIGIIDDQWLSRNFLFSMDAAISWNILPPTSPKNASSDQLFW